MDPDANSTNPRWLSIALTALPILLSVLYLLVVKSTPTPGETQLVAIERKP